MDDINIAELADKARQLGYTNKELVINRLLRRINRDQSYLQYRHSRGRHTSHDDATAEDMVVTALAIELLQSQQ